MHSGRPHTRGDRRDQLLKNRCIIFPENLLNFINCDHDPREILQPFRNRFFVVFYDVIRKATVKGFTSALHLLQNHLEQAQGVVNFIILGDNLDMWNSTIAVFRGGSAIFEIQQPELKILWRIFHTAVQDKTMEKGRFTGSTLTNCNVPNTLTCHCTVLITTAQRQFDNISAGFSDWNVHDISQLVDCLIRGNFIKCNVTFLPAVDRICKGNRSFLGKGIQIAGNMQHIDRFPV